MFTKLLKNHTGFAAGVIFVLLLIAIFAFSWIVTCGIIKLVTLCFGWTFSWRIATGIWLLMCLARSVFKSTVNTKK